MSEKRGRWLLNALTVLSQLTCLAAVALWVRSHWRYDQFQPANGQWSFSTSVGRLWVDHTTIPYFTPNGHQVFPPNARFEAQFPMLFNRTRWAYTDRAGRTVSVLGFVYMRYYYKFAQTCWTTGIAVPLWFVTVSTLTIPALRLRRRLSRVPPGRCACCGYDLTGNVSGVCPECGTAICTTKA